MNTIVFRSQCVGSRESAEDALRRMADIVHSEGSEEFHRELLREALRGVDRLGGERARCRFLEEFEGAGHRSLLFAN